MTDLPDICYSYNPTRKGAERLILLKLGESGFYPTEGYGARSEELVDLFNARLGVTPAQRLAMEAGSHFGFNVPGADPACYADLPGKAPAKGQSLEDFFKEVEAKVRADFKANTPNA